LLNSRKNIGKIEIQPSWGLTLCEFAIAFISLKK